MKSRDHEIDRLAADETVFFAKRIELMREHGDGFVLIHDRVVAGVYPSWDDAFEVGLERFGSQTPFFIRRLTVNEALLEAPALVLGLIDPEIAWP